MLREGAGDVTMRAEVVNTLKACNNVDPIKDNSWGPPLVDADWHHIFGTMPETSRPQAIELTTFHEMPRAKGQP